tara:strand:- start:4709 stop:5785 length:1077 start_codon:yes stop_codon:yes gene_type:complete
MDINDILAKLNKIHDLSGRYDSFNVQNIINELALFNKQGDIVMSDTTRHFYHSHVNENDDVSDVICSYYDRVQKKNNILLNIDKPSLFTNNIKNNIKNIIKKIHTIGFTFLDTIDEKIINTILTKLKNLKFYSRSTRQKIGTQIITIPSIPYYIDHLDTLEAHTYFVNQHNHHDITDLLNIEEISKLIVDPTILQSAQDFLGCIPKLQCLNLWITFKEQTNNRNELSFAAQHWHQDNDCHKFFKVFVYLNDVDEENAAHEIITNSKNTIKNMLKTRPKRRGDIINSKNKQILSGKKGSIILEDTRNNHRGGEVLDPKKYRILLHWWYGSNNYGNKNLQIFDKTKINHTILNDHIGIVL